MWTNNESGEKISVNKLLTDGEEEGLFASSIFENKMQYQMQILILPFFTEQIITFVRRCLEKRKIFLIGFTAVYLYQRRNKDVLAYLRLLINNDDEQAFKRIINFPARGGLTTLNKISIELKINLFLTTHI